MRPRWNTPAGPPISVDDVLACAAALGAREITFRDRRCRRQVSAYDLLVAAVEPASISDPIGHDSEETFADTHSCEAVAERLACARDIARRALAVLSPREQAVVIAHYVHDMSLAEIAKRAGLSGERVRQIRNAALAAMRAAVGSRAVGVPVPLP